MKTKGKPTDLRSLDPAETLATLRAATLSVIDRILGTDTEAVTAGHLNPWLAAERDDSGRARRAIRRAQRTFIFVEPPEDQALWSRLAVHTPPRGIDRLMDLIARLRRNPAVAPAPVGSAALFTPLLNYLVADPILHHDIALRLKRRMENRIVFFPDLPPRPVISLQTVLLLLSGANALAGLSDGAQLNLRSLAVKQSETAGWADFWDLWVIGEGLRTGVLQLPNGVAALPTWTSPDPETGTESEQPGTEARSQSVPDDMRTASGWKARRPDYCMSFRNGVP